MSRDRKHMLYPKNRHVMVNMSAVDYFKLLELKEKLGFSMSKIMRIGLSIVHDYYIGFDKNRRKN